MFNFMNVSHSEALDETISDLIEVLHNMTGDEENYATVAKNLATLLDIKNQAARVDNENLKIQNDHTLNSEKIRLEDEKFAADQERQKSWKPSPDAIVGAAASVVGILFVLHHEKLNVITSKALGFVGKSTK